MRPVFTIYYIYEPHIFTSSVTLLWFAFFLILQVTNLPEEPFTTYEPRPGGQLMTKWVWRHLDEIQTDTCSSSLDIKWLPSSKLRKCNLLSSWHVQWGLLVIFCPSGSAVAEWEISCQRIMHVLPSFGRVYQFWSLWVSLMYWYETMIQFCDIRGTFLFNFIYELGLSYHSGLYCYARHFIHGISIGRVMLQGDTLSTKIYFHNLFSGQKLLI